MDRVDWLGFHPLLGSGSLRKERACLGNFYCELLASVDLVPKICATSREFKQQHSVGEGRRVDGREGRGLPFQLPAGHGCLPRNGRHGSPVKWGLRTPRKGLTVGRRAAGFARMHVRGVWQGAVLRWAWLNWISRHESVTGQPSKPRLAKSGSLQDVHRGHPGVGLCA